MVSTAPSRRKLRIQVLLKARKNSIELFGPPEVGNRVGNRVSIFELQQRRQFLLIELVHARTHVVQQNKVKELLLLGAGGRGTALDNRLPFAPPVVNRYATTFGVSMHPHLPAILFAITSSALAAGVPARIIPDPPRMTVNRVVRVAVNDNRTPAGVLRGTVLTLRLVARTGMWYPDGDSAPGAEVHAFAEEGRAPRIPGPLIRVRAGTEVSITLRNAIPNSTLVLHGLTSRSATTLPVDDSLQLSTGASRTQRIRLDSPGTYYYWGTTMGRTLGERTKEDAQLTGAIIVDPADGPVPADRVLLIGMWSDTAGHVPVDRNRLLAAVNGRSWPHTERLHYTVGDTIRWRVINASADSHPMHLHGFYFLVDARGNGLTDTLYARDRRDLVVTNNLRPGSTMSMTWAPDRAGNWLFHCHLPDHFARRGSLGSLAQKLPHGEMNHALQGMSGLVTGVVVRDKPGSAGSVVLAGGASRQLRLVIRPNAQGSPAAPAFEYALEDARAMAPASSDGRAAPRLVLTRGEPVAITVVNALDEPTAVHWHGIELESYFDGVAGFSGAGQRLSPAIAPRDSFVARFTPPRAGSFIYHTHVDEGLQLPAGLAGPIVVVEPGVRYDPATDLTVLASNSRQRSVNGVRPLAIWLNGSAAPPPLNLQAGVRYRLRFINMTMNSPNLRFELVQDGTPVRWKPLAKDGADLPADRQIVRAARQPVSIGETNDVELVLERGGEYRLDARLGDGTLVGSMAVHVTTTAP